MTVYTVTLELPVEIYQQAEQIARVTQRPVEQVVVEWIHPPQTEKAEILTALENLSNEQLIQTAQASVLPDSSRRLQELLAVQEQRTLTESEQHEAATLVEQEDLLTLRKAKALFLLKQRGILPDDLTKFLG
jgi:hypothetical protein